MATNPFSQRVTPPSGMPQGGQTMWGAAAPQNYGPQGVPPQAQDSQSFYRPGVSSPILKKNAGLA